MAKTIAVTGKGGTGKTTLAALIIRHLRNAKAGAVLAVDADPDANLATVLGIPLQKTIGDLREETLREMKDFPPGMSKSAYIQAGLHEIIEETDGVDLVAMGRSEGPSCYCYVNNLLRKFSTDLMPCYDWMVFDNEAGMEHISRQTAARVDHLLVVVNETPLASDCARRIVQLVGELSNPVGRKYLVLNSVRADRVESLRERTADLDLEFLGAVPFDESVEQAIFEGRSLYELGDSPAVLKVNEIMASIGEEHADR